MTNGEKLQELFSNLKLEIYWDVVRAKYCIVADKKWWDSEYRESIKVESEESDVC